LPLDTLRPLAGVKSGYVHLCRVAGNTVWSHWQATFGSSEITEMCVSFCDVMNDLSVDAAA